MFVKKKFQSYEKIASSIERWSLSPVDHRRFSKTKWAVTEKIHGAHFCFVIDGDHVRCAKRKSLLSSDENFFGHRRLLPTMRRPLLRFMERLRAEHPWVVKCVLHGEIFGGAYPHPDVEEVSTVQAIQTGVYYCPDVCYSVFDVALEGTGGERQYLDQDVLWRCCETAGIFYAKPLLIGSFESAMAHPACFTSTVPRLLGLPALEAPNHAEGIVIKPVKTFEVETPKGLLRPVLKLKHPDFEEDARFHRAQRWAGRSAVIAPKNELETLCEIAEALATAQRLDSVRSKVGAIQRGESRRARRLYSLFVEDLNADLLEKQKTSIRRLSQTDASSLQRFIRRASSARFNGFFRDYFCAPKK